MGMRKFDERALLDILLVIALALGSSLQAPAVFAQDNSLGVPHDVIAYAEANRIDLEEALQRLKWQAQAIQLEADLASNSPLAFGGLRIVHSPQFKVVVYATDHHLEILLSQVARSPVNGLVEVREVERSLMELELAHEHLWAAIRNTDLAVDTGLNYELNRIELYVLDKAEFRSELEYLGIELDSSVAVLEVNHLATPVANIYGGLGLSTCTSGFAVKKDTTGTKGISTAGHCSNTQSYSGSSLPFQVEAYSGSLDLQWHTAPGFTIKNWVHDGLSDSTTPYYRHITSTKSRTNQTVGEFVCKYGMTTKYGCGYITDKNFGSTQCVPSSTATYIRVHRDNVDLSSSGDSGGPWFYNETAYGSMVCEVNSIDGVYMASNYFSGMGLSILTSP